MKTYCNTVNTKIVDLSAILSTNPAPAKRWKRPRRTPPREDAGGGGSRCTRTQLAWAARPDAERKALMMKVAEVPGQHSGRTGLLGHASRASPWRCGPRPGPAHALKSWGCKVWTQVTASLDLPADVVFEDDTRRDEMHLLANPLA